MNKQNSILLIITGSIAASKAKILMKYLLEENIAVDVVLTKAGLEFVTETELKQSGARCVFSDLFDAEMEDKIGHIELSRRNDLVLIYPATANFMAKMVSGVADDLASTLVLAANKKIFIAPAMNVEMWHNKITQENVRKLEKNNCEIIYPEKGMLACKEEGEGRLKEPEEMITTIKDHFSLKNIFNNKKILITLGGTQEKIDPVRYIGNFSSGKQGLAFAKKFKSYGADVTIVKAAVTCHIPAGFNIIDARSADEMLKIAKEQTAKQKFDYAIFAAAVADYKIKNYSDKKIKKEALDEVILTLVKNPDILAEISNSKNRPKIIIGFAAETNNHLENAKRKYNNKKCDYLILNDVSQNKVFGKEDNDVILIAKNNEIDIKGTKDKIATQIIKAISS